MFKNSHSTELYNTLLMLSRNIFFYQKIKLADNFETRIYLMFVHFSIMMKICKKKGVKFDQKEYDNLFHNIENNLREAGLGDVSVNKKMKDFNKLLYDILLKLEDNDHQIFNLNEKLILRYFKEIKDVKSSNYNDFKRYFIKFYEFCFKLPVKNMVREAINFRNNYGSS